MKKIYFLIGILIFLQACNSPLDKKFNEDTAKEDLKAIEKELDSTELEILAGSLLMLKLQDKKLEEYTYSEILNEGKAWKEEQAKKEAEQKALAAKAAQEEQQRIKRLTEAVIVTCFDKGYTEVDYEDYITYKFAIQNKSDKSIRALKGSITFTNLFDEEIKSLNFVYDQPISAGQKITWNATTDYNQFMNEDQTLKNKQLKDLKVIWEPVKIIFEDGSILE